MNGMSGSGLSIFSGNFYVYGVGDIVDFVFMIGCKANELVIIKSTPADAAAYATLLHLVVLNGTKFST